MRIDLRAIVCDLIVEPVGLDQIDRMVVLIRKAALAEALTAATIENAKVLHGWSRLALSSTRSIVVPKATPDYGMEGEFTVASVYPWPEGLWTATIHGHNGRSTVIGTPFTFIREAEEALDRVLVADGWTLTDTPEPS